MTAAKQHKILFKKQKKDQKEQNHKQVIEPIDERVFLPVQLFEYIVKHTHRCVVFASGKIQAF